MSALDGAGLPTGYPYRAEDETTPRELAALLSGKASVVILDVRTGPEWEICKIAGARLLPLQELDRRIDDLKADLEDNLSTRVVVHCHHGRRSLTATHVLRAAGFTNVTSLAGGISLWAQDIDRTMATY